MNIEKEYDILKLMIETSQDGLTYTDETGIIRYNNKAYTDITGIKDEYLNGESIFELEKRGFPVSTMVHEVFKKRETVSKVINYGESDKEIIVTIEPAYDEHGNFKGIVGNVRNYTKLSELRNEISTIKAKYNAEKMRSEEINKALETQKIKNEELIRQINQMREENGDLLQGMDMSSYSINLFEIAKRVAEVDSTVLITGESGVGKDVFCQLVHRLQGGDKPYIKVSCGAIPETLMESELFGYEAGAFTGASKKGKKGAFELAKDGVLFLDEVGELPLDLQVKLLTVLQDRKFYRIGGTEEVEVRAKVISATNKNLMESIKRGEFREDLYYRLNVVPVHIRPLRQRKDEIIPLASSYLQKLNERHNTNIVLSREVREILKNYDWPGNIRELNNIVERMYVFSTGEIIEVEDVPDEIKKSSGEYLKIKEGTSLKDQLEDIEAQIILNQLNSNQSLKEISENLGIDVSTLHRKINKYHLPKRYGS